MRAAGAVAGTAMHAAATARAAIHLQLRPMFPPCLERPDDLTVANTLGRCSLRTAPLRANPKVGGGARRPERRLWARPAVKSRDLHAGSRPAVPSRIRCPVPGDSFLRRL